MFKKLWRGFIGTLGCLVRRPSQPDRRLLCHLCAEHNRWAFYQLIYRVRGEHVCENCGRKFVVTLTPNSVICAIKPNAEHEPPRERKP